MKKQTIEVREKGINYGEPGELIEVIKRKVWAEQIGNFNPIFCTYKGKRTLVSSKEGDISDPFRRDESYLDTLYIEVDGKAPVKPTMRKYKIYDYDLWADGEGGLTVNDVYPGEVIEIADNLTDKELIRELKRQGQIKSGIHYASIDILGEPDYTLYFNYKGNPGFELRYIAE